MSTKAGRDLYEQAQRYRHLALIRAVRDHRRGTGSFWTVAAAQREATDHERRQLQTRESDA